MTGQILFVHNNFPGQFRDLVTTLTQRGVRCWGLGQAHAPGLGGVTMARYVLPAGTTPGLLPEVIRPEADLIRARGAYNGAKLLADAGADPDVIVGHSGWGETLHLRSLFPRARLILFAEYWYRGRGADVGFDPEISEPLTDERVSVIETKNMAMALSYAGADAIVAPTRFQASILPETFQARARVIHEGVDTDAIRPGPAQPFELPDGRVLAPGTPVVTHVNNNMEPLRGLHVFARALPRFLAERPDAHVLIIGEEKKAGYGGAAPDGLTWKEWSFRNLQLDPARVHFLGKVPHDRMLAALRLGMAHVYYTFPFVLSWSICEAMSLGAYVIGSDTAPVRDAIDDGVNGRLLNFFDHGALAQALIEACRDPAATAAMRARARETAVARFSRHQGRARWIALLEEFGVQVPPPEAPAA